MTHPNYAQRLFRKFGTEPELCIDEGCDWRGVPHVCGHPVNPCVKTSCEHHGNAQTCADSRERSECAPEFQGSAAKRLDTEAPKGAPEIPFKDEEHILVPRGLVSAACAAIDRKQSAPKLLEAMRYLALKGDAIIDGVVWPKLEKPAFVFENGAFTFHAGVSARFVVEACYRNYERAEAAPKRTPEERHEEEMRRRAAWDFLNGAAQDHHVKDPCPMAKEPDAASFAVGDKAQKVSGGYRDDGTIVAVFKTTGGDARYVFEFDQPHGRQPHGRLRILNPDQLTRPDHMEKDA